jgi:hypothetical protein
MAIVAVAMDNSTKIYRGRTFWRKSSKPIKQQLLEILWAVTIKRYCQILSITF